MAQLSLFDPADATGTPISPFRTQLLKWIGNKQRFTHNIIGHFPKQRRRYFEPFLGSGAVLGTLAPADAIASDALVPLVEIWQTLREAPHQLTEWYATRWEQFATGDDRVAQYESIKANYNAKPNGADLVFLCRSCYGGVVRFRKKDGYMSTPVGAHRPIAPEKFGHRVDMWHERTKGTKFLLSDFAGCMEMAGEGDMIYCDPPYVHTQAILYGAQAFSLERLFDAITRAKRRGAFVALSIDGTKRSGRTRCEISPPTGLFETEVRIDGGRSMLRRFQMAGNYSATGAAGMKGFPSKAS